MKYAVSTFVGFLFVALSANAATITPKTPALVDSCYQISDAAELYGFAAIVNGVGEGNLPQENVCGKLTQNIVVNEAVLDSEGKLNSQKDFVSWTPMKNFEGIFDGNNHVIYGLYFNDSNEDHIGLFASASGAKILNLGLEDFYFGGKDEIGGFIGFVNDYSKDPMEITNSYAAGLIDGGASVGGFVGNAAWQKGAVVISGCHNLSMVNGTYHVGGFIGSLYEDEAEIINSYNSGVVSGTSSVGGLVGTAGRAIAKINQSYNAGRVAGQLKIGGLVGNVNSYGYALLVNVYNKGPVEGTSRVGGIVGYEEGVDHIGGGVTLLNAYNAGRVTFSADSSQKAGTIVGYGYGDGDIVFDNCFYLKQDELVAASVADTTSKEIDAFAVTEDQLMDGLVADSLRGWVEKYRNGTVVEDGANGLVWAKDSAGSYVLPHFNWENATGSSVVESSSSVELSSSSEQTTSLELTLVPQFSVNVENRNLQVAGARVGDRYALFDMQGNVVFRGTVNSSNFNMVVPVSGNYVLRIGNGCRKVSVRF